MNNPQTLFLLQQQQLQAAFLQANAQMEPIPSGNLPPGFDSTSCRSVYIGNIPTDVSEADLQMIFQSYGALEGCKLIRKEKSSYGFVDYFDHRSAELAISNCNGKSIYGQPLKVNWAYTSSQREDTSGHYNIFVGDISPEITDASLYLFFSAYPTCSDARVMWDQKTGRSRGYGFVSFRSQQDAQNAINDLSGKWLGSRQIRCNWATKGAGAYDDKQNTEVKSAAELANVSHENDQEASIDGGPEKNPQYTTVYVGNLAPEVAQLDLHRFFHGLGVGAIEEVRIQREKGFGFVRYSEHTAAALAIQCGNNCVLFGKRVKCSWGNKPTPPGMSSSPLPPPAGVALPDPTAADLLAFDHQYALNKMAAAQGVMHPQTMVINQASAMVTGTAASQGIYDAGYQSSRAHPIMYFH